MSEHVQKRRLSLISDMIIFLVITLIVILMLKKFDFTSVIGYYTNEQTNSLVGDSSESITDENELYVSKIKKEYGITVLYGEKVRSFSDKVDATVQYDSYIINNNLRVLYDALEKYPQEVFDKLKDGGYPFYVIIVDKFQNDNLALASRNNLDEFRIYICNAQKFERAFHHEMYHILEYYMKDNTNSIYIDWNDLNPKNFKYESNVDNLTRDYVFDSNSYDEDNTYFVTKYSKCSEKEDRAEIFAEIMTMNRKQKYLDSNENIRKKVDLITYMIGNNIASINNFYFSRFIY